MAEKEFKDYMKEFEEVLSMYAEQKKTLDQVDALEKEDKTIKGQTKVDSGRLKQVKESEEYIRAKAVEKAYKFTEKRTAERIKDGLAGLVNETEPSKLIQAISRSIPHDKSEIGKKLGDYALYHELFNPISEEQGGSKERMTAIVKEVQKKLPEIIKRKIEEKTGDKELAEAWADYLALITGEETFKEYVTGEMTIIETELSTKKSDITSYIKNNLKEDKGYVNLGMQLYHAAKKEDKK